MALIVIIPFILGLMAFSFGGNAAVMTARIIVGGFGLFALLVLRAIFIGAY